MIYFLEQLLILLGLTFIGNGIGYLTYYVILNQLNPHFPQLEHRQKMRTLKNLTKATILAYLTIYTTPHIWAIYKTGVWDNDLVTWIGNVYVSTDLAGLFYVGNSLPKLTKIHHTVVFFLGIMNILADYSQPGTHRNMVILAYFSLIPYSVNCLLGTKDLRFPSLFYRILGVWSSILYGLCITVNFIFQHINILHYNQDHWQIRYGFLAIYYLILLDDLNLMKWLVKISINPVFEEDLTASQQDPAATGLPSVIPTSTDLTSTTHVDPLVESNDQFEEANSSFSENK